LWINYWNGERDKTIVGKRGDIFYCVANSISETIYKECFSSLAIVFFPEFIRFVYYDYNDKKTAPMDAPDIYYHTSKPIRGAVRYVLMALNELAMTPEGERAECIQLARGVVELALHALQEDAPIMHGKAFGTWRRIENYINQNCGEPISRASIAKHFQLSGCYLSVICRKFTGKSFNEFLMDLRLQRASMLLTETNFTLDEISDRCGFRYTSYFIRVFKRSYGTTPSKFREAT
jgi:AraC-like DNA-binding protein